MSKGGAVVGLGFIFMTYLGALAFAQVLLFAFAALAVALIVTAGIVIVALIAWTRCIRSALALRDYHWLRDLILVPAAGLLGAVFFGQQVAVLMRDFTLSESRQAWEEWFSHFPGLLAALVLGPAMFF